MISASCTKSRRPRALRASSGASVFTAIRRRRLGSYICRTVAVPPAPISPSSCSATGTTLRRLWSGRRRGRGRRRERSAYFSWPAPRSRPEGQSRSPRRSRNCGPCAGGPRGPRPNGSAAFQHRRQRLGRQRLRAGRRLQHGRERLGTRRLIHRIDRSNLLGRRDTRLARAPRGGGRNRRHVAARLARLNRVDLGDPEHRREALLGPRARVDEVSVARRADGAGARRELVGGQRARARVLLVFLDRRELRESRPAAGGR